MSHLDPAVPAPLPTGELQEALLAHHVEITDQLRAALSSRTVIDQAIGIIMARERCDADAAFAVLRATSQNRNVKLRDIATEIVKAVSSKPPRPGHLLHG